MMNIERFEQRKQEFSKALSRLKDALDQPENEFTRDAVIQRFEFTYELAWKVIKLYLEDKDIIVLNPKDALAEGLAQRIIDDGNGWSELHRRRNETSHTYREEMAIEVYGFIKHSGFGLFEALKTKLGA